MKLSAALAKEFVNTWNVGGTVLGALMRAEKMSGEVVEPSWWAEAMERNGLAPNVFLRQDIRQFIAHYFHNANNALWDGRHTLAYRWMISGKDITHKTRTPRCQARDAIGTGSDGKLFIKVRECDKRSDWRTVK